MIRYLNIKTPQGIETVDDLNEKDFKDYNEFRTELRRLKNEYKISGGFYNGIYTSRRSTNDWRNK